MRYFEEDPRLDDNFRVKYWQAYLTAVNDPEQLSSRSHVPLFYGINRPKMKILKDIFDRIAVPEIVIDEFYRYFQTARDGMNMK
jgi:hypothetical protein